MKSYLIFIGCLLFLSCSNEKSSSQTSDQIQISNIDTNIIDLPAWFGDNELETIKKIESQKTLDYNDYIQLAVSYAQLDADSSKIGDLVEQSLNANSKEACKTLSFLLDNRSNWKITSQYKDVVNSKLLSFNCN